MKSWLPVVTDPTHDHKTAMIPAFRRPLSVVIILRVFFFNLRPLHLLFNVIKRCAMYTPTNGAPMIVKSAACVPRKERSGMNGQTYKFHGSVTFTHLLVGTIVSCHSSVWLNAAGPSYSSRKRYVSIRRMAPPLVGRFLPNSRDKYLCLRSSTIVRSTVDAVPRNCYCK